MGAVKDLSGTYATGLSLVAVAFAAGTLVLLELGAHWTAWWHADMVRQSGIFCYRGFVRGLFGEEVA